MISDCIPFDSDGLDGTVSDADRFDGIAFDPAHVAARAPGHWRVGP